MGVYILRPHAAGILYAPPFYTPPTPRRVFSGVGGWGCIKFGPVTFPCEKPKFSVDKLLQERRENTTFSILGTFSRRLVVVLFFFFCRQASAGAQGEYYFQHFGDIFSTFGGGSLFFFSVRNEKSAQRPKFSAGRPCGHPAKNFGQAFPILAKQAFWHRHAARTSTKKLRSEKLRADFSFPILLSGGHERPLLT